jgi:diguanylate cyclase (GGDEF)-like protein
MGGPGIGARGAGGLAAEGTGADDAPGAAGSDESVHPTVLEILREAGLDPYEVPSPRQWRDLLISVSRLVERSEARLEAMERRRRGRRPAYGARLQWPAEMTDPASRLPNRRAVVNGLATTLALGAEGSEAALLIVHLDGLPHLGHGFSDGVTGAALAAAAVRIRSVVRDCDLVGRVHPDRLAVVLGEFWSPFAAASLARRIERAFGDDLVSSRSQLRLRATVGAALAHTGANPDDVLQRANAAVDEAVQLRYGTASITSPRRPSSGPSVAPQSTPSTQLRS